MARSLVSWLIAGFATYAWFYAGYAWPMLSALPVPIWILFTIVIVVMHISVGKQGGANVIETITNRFKIVAKHAIGLIIAVEVGAVMSFVLRGANAFLASLILVVLCAIITTILVASIEDATK